VVLQEEDSLQARSHNPASICKFLSTDEKEDIPERKGCPLLSCRGIPQAV
jgi:hypothetical protein